MKRGYGETQPTPARSFPRGQCVQKNKAINKQGWNTENGRRITSYIFLIGTE